MRAPADGYTLLGIRRGRRHQCDAVRQSQLQFHPRHRAVVGIIRGPLVMMVHPSVPAKTVPEFIAYAKANPGKISMASAGSGNATHLAGELFKVMTDIGHDACALSRRRARHRRPARRPGAGLFRQRAGRDRAYPGRQAARAGGDDLDALRAIARRPDGRRIRAGLRGEPVVRGRLAHQHGGARSSISSTGRSTPRSRTPR